MGWKSRLSDCLKLGCTIGLIRSNQWWLDAQLHTEQHRVDMGPVFNMFITTSITPSTSLASLQTRCEQLMLTGLLQFSVILRNVRTGPTEML